MRIAVSVSVKDEVELIEMTIAHLRSIGADAIVACDVASTDGTLEILRRHAAQNDLVLVQLTDEASTAEWSAANLEIIRKMDVDWVAFIDGDELLLPATGSLKSCALAGSDIAYVGRFNVPVGPAGPIMPNKPGPDLSDELLMIVEPIPDFRKYLQANPATPWIRGVPGRRFVARPEVIRAVKDGAHRIEPVEGRRLREIKSKDLLVAHLPFTTRSRFARKLKNIRRVFEIHDENMSDDFGWHWRRWLALANEAEVDAEFDRNVFDAERISELRASGTILSAAEMFRKLADGVAR